jgi:SET domain-containing protein 6
VTIMRRWFRRSRYIYPFTFPPVLFSLTRRV